MTPPLQPNVRPGSKTPWPLYKKVNFVVESQIKAHLLDLFKLNNFKKDIYALKCILFLLNSRLDTPFARFRSKYTNVISIKSHLFTDFGTWLLKLTYFSLLYHVTSFILIRFKQDIWYGIYFYLNNNAIHSQRIK